MNVDINIYNGISCAVSALVSGLLGSMAFSLLWMLSPSWLTLHNCPARNSSFAWDLFFFWETAENSAVTSMTYCFSHLGSLVANSGMWNWALTISSVGTITFSWLVRFAMVSWCLLYTTTIGTCSHPCCHQDVALLRTVHLCTLVCPRQMGHSYKIWHHSHPYITAQLPAIAPSPSHHALCHITASPSPHTTATPPHITP